MVLQSTHISCLQGHESSPNLILLYKQLIENMYLGHSLPEPRLKPWMMIPNKSPNLGHIHHTAKVGISAVWAIAMCSKQSTPYLCSAKESCPTGTVRVSHCQTRCDLPVKSEEWDIHSLGQSDAVSHPTLQLWQAGHIWCSKKTSYLTSKPAIFSA